jgi:hypothetical protein
MTKHTRQGMALFLAVVLLFTFYGCKPANNASSSMNSSSDKDSAVSSAISSSTADSGSNSSDSSSGPGIDSSSTESSGNSQSTTSKIYLNTKKINSFDYSAPDFPELLNNAEPIKIWSAENTVSITQNQKSNKYVKANIYMESAKNESESAQIIITPNKNINSYNVEAFDLVQGSKIISKDNIKLYRQHYIAIYEGNNAVFYPDALIPVQKSFEKGENKILKDENQGIWITVNVPAGSQSGIYNSKIKITLDGKSFIVPVTLKVYNFDLPTETTSKSAFALNDFDVPQTDVSMKTYYDYFLKYRISTTQLPIAKPGNLSNYQYALKVKEYITNKQVTGFAIYYTTKYEIHPVYKVEYYTVDYADLKGRIEELVRQSTNNLDILSKAYLYLGQILDEPSKGNYWRVKDVCTKLEQMKKDIANDASLFPLDGSKNGVKKSLLNLRNIVTTQLQYDVPQNNNLDNGNFTGYINTWCPLVNYYNDDEYVYWANQRLKANDKLWAYICDLPDAPYPTYHINDGLISMREFSWMRKKNNIEGELYWATTLYKKYEGSAYVSRDVWTDAYSFGRAPGEGFLVYPGTKYNMTDPLPTIRLEAIRDGIEDFEYISILERELSKANRKYGTSFDVNKYIENLYNSMFEGTVSNNNITSLKQARKEIASLIGAIQSNSNAIISIDNKIDTNKAKLKIYTSKNTVVMVDNKKVSSTNITNGSVAECEIDMFFAQNGINVELVNGGQKVSIKRYLGGSSKGLVIFNEENMSVLRKSDYNTSDSIENVKLNFVKTVSGRTGDFIKLNIKGLSGVSLGYKHYLKAVFDSNSTNGISPVTNSVKFWVFNNSAKGERIYLTLKDNKSEKEIGYKYALPKQWTLLSYDISKTSVNKDKISEMKLSVKNRANLNAELYFGQINIVK